MNKLTPSEKGRLLAMENVWTPEKRKAQAERMKEARRKNPRNKKEFEKDPVDKSLDSA